MAASPPFSILVDPNVSRAKLTRELDAWSRNEADYRRKGWIILRADVADLIVDVAFLALIPMGGTQVPIVVPSIRLDYRNYDLWPPSLTFIDPFTGRPAPSPLNEAWLPDQDGQPRNVLMTNAAGKQFLCFPGTREYHEHPDHDGDVWALYRDDRRGSVAVICDRVWSMMTSAVAGIQMQMQPVLLAPSPGLPLERAQDTARQARAAYDAQVTAYETELKSKTGDP